MHIRDDAYPKNITIRCQCDDPTNANEGNHNGKRPELGFHLDLPEISQECHESLAGRARENKA